MTARSWGQVFPRALGKRYDLPRQRARSANRGPRPSEHPTVAAIPASAGKRQHCENRGASPVSCSCRSYGGWLLAATHGIDERPLSTSSEPKSISRETTFGRDLHPRDDRQTLSGFSRHSVAKSPRICAARTTGAEASASRYATPTSSSDLSLPSAIDDAQCLRGVLLERKLCVLGMRVIALSARGAAET